MNPGRGGCQTWNDARHDDEDSVDKVGFLMDAQPGDAASLGGLYRWLTPLLIVALGSIIAWLGSALVEQNQDQNVTLTHIEVQLARMQAQASFAQGQTGAMQAQINQILTIQSLHEHRITVLEDASPPRRN